MRATIHEHCTKSPAGMGFDVVNLKPGSYQFVMNDAIRGFSSKQSAEGRGQAACVRSEPCVSRTQCEPIGVAHSCNRDNLNGQKECLGHVGDEG